MSDGDVRPARTQAANLMTADRATEVGENGTRRCGAIPSADIVASVNDASAYDEASSVDEVAQMRAARHDPAQFEPIYRAYFPRIYAYCWHRVSSPQEAEDLTSLVFTRALAALDQYRGGSVAGWLFRIARNAIANYHRDRRLLVPLDSEVVDDAATPLEQLVRAEDRRSVHRLLATLPERDRELLTLKIDGGLRADEIGAVLGISAGAVRVRLHRILRRLRQQIAEESSQP